MRRLPHLVGDPEVPNGTEIRMVVFAAKPRNKWSKNFDIRATPFKKQNKKQIRMRYRPTSARFKGKRGETAVKIPTRNRRAKRGFFFFDPNAAQNKKPK